MKRAHSSSSECPPTAAGAKCRTRVFKRTCTAALLIALTACSDSKQASEKNFKNAIQAYLDTVYPKCVVNENFPAVVNSDFLGKRKVLQSLAKAGLVSETELSRKEYKDWNGSTNVVVKSEYALTETGRKFYDPNARQTLSRDQGGFCIGKAAVREITRYTEPADMFGHRITKVNYTYSVDKLPDWANLPEVTSAIPALKEAVESGAKPIKATHTLVLTNNGWVHERLFAD